MNFRLLWRPSWPGSWPTCVELNLRYIYIFHSIRSLIIFNHSFLVSFSHTRDTFHFYLWWSIKLEEGRKKKLGSITRCSSGRCILSAETTINIHVVDLRIHHSGSFSLSLIESFAGYDVIIQF